MSRELKLLYMNSFSRSGETLMQRTLNAHKNISALIQLKKTGTEIELQYEIFKKIRVSKPDTITLTEEEFTTLELPEETKILLVKNAVFLNKENKYSFMLLRNPYSVYASYRKLSNSLKDPRQQMRNWANNIDQNLIDLVDYGDFLEAVMSIYLKKTLTEINTSNTIVKYENFIAEPEKTLKTLLKELSVDWDPAVLEAHEQYEIGELGHGGIELWQPIRSEKANMLPENLSDSEIFRIYGFCSILIDRAGYDIRNNRLIF